MKKTIGFPLKMFGAFALLGAAGLGHAAEQITHYTYGNGKVDQWFIVLESLTCFKFRFVSSPQVAAGSAANEAVPAPSEAATNRAISVRFIRALSLVVSVVTVIGQRQSMVGARP